MAISGSTTPVLEIVREMLASKERGRESEKDRAMQLLGMRLRVDEARKDRLQQEFMFREKQTAEMEQTLLKAETALSSLGIAQEKMKPSEDDPTKPVGQGAAVVELMKGVRVDEAQDILDKIERNVSKQKDIKAKLKNIHSIAKEYYEGVAKGDEALYHQVRALQKDVGDWVEKKIGKFEVSDIEKQAAYDILGNLSEAQMAGVRAGLDKYATEAV